jgi:aspartyl-tRNA(Asn)/glutamyl-tRNA(Gln) amidotransferase subunit A
MGAAALADAMRAGDVSAREVTDAHLDVIAAHDGIAADGDVWHALPAEQLGPDDVHAFLVVTAARARAQADDVDRRRVAGETLGPLAGVPLALKDVLTMRGVPTTCGSRMLEGWVPPYDATVTRRLLDADVVVLGKTNMDEFAMGSSTENSAYGPTRNPWDLDRVPGGSSGGSAAAVAAGMAPLAIGTDTGGSIRQPAAFTGIVGAKPTYGSVSRHGLIAFASSLDQAGPFARDVTDTALLQELIQGHDSHDATSDALDRDDLLASLRAGVEESYQDVRELLQNYRTRLQEGNFVQSLEVTVAKFRRQTGIEISLQADTDGAPFPREQQLQMLLETILKLFLMVECDAVAMLSKRLLWEQKQ